MSPNCHWHICSKFKPKFYLKFIIITIIITIL
jgi:hypothetical protein